jgi:hypothetical protein
MQTDVTDVVQRYRLALRDIWNSFIWPDERQRSWEAVYAFRDLKLPLFRAIVAGPLGIEDSDRIFGDGFTVGPSPSSGGCIPDLRINLRVPSRPDEGVWQPLSGPFKADEIKATLLDLFDWSPLGYIDFRYFVVRLEALQNHPDRVGQHALIDVGYARVLWSPPDEASHAAEPPG